MKRTIVLMFVLMALVSVHAGLAQQKSCVVEAGPIWNQQDAEAKCPGVCQKANGTWNGQWKTTEPGKMSVCGCLICKPQS